HRAYVPGDLRFCFRAEDGIRDRNVTGVQTCALPISLYSSISIVISPRLLRKNTALHLTSSTGSKWRDEHAVRRIFCCSPGGSAEIGRASCRERVEKLVIHESTQQKEKHQMGEPRKDK